MLLRWASALGVSINTYARLIGAEGRSRGSEDFSGGRLSVVPDAIREIVDHPVLGYGARFAEAYGVWPHSPVLSFGISAGIVAAALTLALSIRLMFSLAQSMHSDASERRVAFLVLAVLLASVVVEPDGPFVGLETTLLLLLALVQVGGGESKMLDSPAIRSEPRYPLPPASPDMTHVRTGPL